MVSAIALLLFIGATGKSAQIPLYVWLPDAMEGPTPVSALIHAATMVTAGVYLIGRNAVLFAHAPEVLTIVAVIGTATALWAGAIGMVQNDIKRVLAYSTVSQLGYMFMAMGVGAYAAGIFHLFTHAFFKALLFLGSGAVIHALAGEQDLRRMGGLKKELPVTYWTFLIGALAIAGVPGLAGFFSKDEILYRTFAGGHTLLWAVGAVTSLMTAFYMFRLVFLAFHGERGSRAEALATTSRPLPPMRTARRCTSSALAASRAHLHDAPRAMAIPLVVLAIGSVLAGYLNVPAALGGSAFLEHFLEPSLHVPAMAGAHAAAEHADHALELDADGRVVAHRVRRHRHRGVPVSEAPGDAGRARREIPRCVSVPRATRATSTSCTTPSSCSRSRRCRSTCCGRPMRGSSTAPSTAPGSIVVETGCARAPDSDRLGAHLRRVGAASGPS